MVTPSIVLAVLFAAMLHAVWNSLAHAVSDRLVGFAMIGLVDAVGGAALAASGGLPPAGAWPFIVASALVHTAYNLLLLASYQLGEFSQMYPLARGTSPWVVALVSMVVLNRALSVTELAGVLAVSAGLIGLMIASYTVIDGVGVAHAPLLSYAGWMFLLQAPPIVAIALIRRRGQLARAVRTSAVPGLAGGAISQVAYTIVLWAQTSGALAPIAALRETSIVFGALIGALCLGERLGPRRAIAAAVVLAGVVLISLP
jgi:uncharacterized membrane protein